MGTTIALKATDRDTVQYEGLLFRILYYRVANRTIEAARKVLMGRPDPAFSPEMLQLADEIDSVADRGAAKIDVTGAASKAELAELGDSDPSYAAIVGTTMAIDEIERKVFAEAKRFAIATRELAGTLPTMARLQRFLIETLESRARTEAIADEQNAVLARSN